jgi:hypothetical protein
MASGKTTLVSPRDATVVKHFYSLDVDGARHPLLEDALAKVENAAAPVIRELCDVGEDGLATRPELLLYERSKLALFIGTSRIRTPIWREQTRSVFNQFADFHAEDRESGDSPFRPTENDLIAQVGVVGSYSGWVLCMLDWTFARPESGAFIVGDTPVSVFDPTPKYPGSGAGVMSSPNSQLFAPLDPKLGLVVRPNPERMEELYDAAEKLGKPRVTDDVAARVVGELEGTVAEAMVTERVINDLNLRTYANAQRYVYGSQRAVTDTRRRAKARPSRVGTYAPAPSRLHILEDHPDEPGHMRAVRVFEGPTSLPSRRRRA